MKEPWNHEWEKFIQRKYCHGPCRECPIEIYMRANTKHRSCLEVTEDSPVEIMTILSDICQNHEAKNISGTDDE